MCVPHKSFPHFTSILTIGPPPPRTVCILYKPQTPSSLQLLYYLQKRLYFLSISLSFCLCFVLSVKTFLFVQEKIKWSSSMQHLTATYPQTWSTVASIISIIEEKKEVMKSTMLLLSAWITSQSLFFLHLVLQATTRIISGLVDGSSHQWIQDTGTFQNTT